MPMSNSVGESPDGLTARMTLPGQHSVTGSLKVITGKEGDQRRFVRGRGNRIRTVGAFRRSRRYCRPRRHTRKTHDHRDGRAWFRGL